MPESRASRHFGLPHIDASAGEMRGRISFFQYNAHKMMMIAFYIGADDYAAGASKNAL